MRQKCWGFGFINQKNKEIKKEKEPYIPSILELPRYNIKPIENNILDLLPESKFDLDKFKIEFLKNNNKKNGMKYFWKNYDPDGYSLWFIEYNNDINECITLFRTCIIKGNILEQLKYFKKYCFGVLGVYGNNYNYLNNSKKLRIIKEEEEQNKKEYMISFNKRNKLRKNTRRK